MPAPAHFALLALFAAVAPVAAQEMDPEQSALLEKARLSALRYSNSLPDFICTESVTRQQDPQGSGRWKLLDKLTIKLSYFDHKEDYKLMEINGRPTVLDYMYVGGAVSTGEFGTRLYSVFDPRSHGEFQWKGWTTIRKRRVAHFAYHIPKEHSIYRIQWGNVPAGPNSIIVPYHGEVFVDEETNLVLRLTQRAEIPPNFPINANESIVDYDFADVGGKQHLLPVHAYLRTRSGHFVAENNMDFRDYRKFQTEANITFESAPDKE